MANSSAIRRAYDTIALFALLNVVAMGAMLSWLVGTGAVDREKVARITAVLGGEDQPVETTAGAQQTEPEVEATEPFSEPPSVATSQMNMEIVRREADRIKEELRQRLASNGVGSSVQKHLDLGVVSFS